MVPHGGRLNRRDFIVASAGLLVPATLGQGYYFSRPAAGGGGGPSDAFSSYSTGSTRSNFTGEVGYSFIPNANISVTRLARWVISGNSQTHTLRIRNAAGADLGNVAVNTSGAGVGAWLWGTLGAPVALSSGTRYWILSAETTGGDLWYEENGTLTYSGDWTGIETGGQSGYYDGSSQLGSSPDNAFGVPNFTFTF